MTCLRRSASRVPPLRGLPSTGVQTIVSGRSYGAVRLRGLTGCRRAGDRLCSAWQDDAAAGAAEGRKNVLRVWGILGRETPFPVFNPLARFYVPPFYGRARNAPEEGVEKTTIIQRLCGLSDPETPRLCLETVTVCDAPVYSIASTRKPHLPLVKSLLRGAARDFLLGTR